MTDVVSGVHDLLDGAFPFDPRLIDGVADDPGAAAALGFEAMPDTVPVEVHAFLLDLREGPVLIDAGAGPLLGAGLGRVAGALDALGVAPIDVAAVALTHLHGDHCGGLIDADGAARFPRAAVLLPERERRAWLAAPGGGVGAPLQGRNGIAADAARALTPYADRIEPVGEGWRGRGLEALPAPGHTPGHTAYLAPALGALVGGDAVHLAAIQIPRPGRSSAWDMDPAATAGSRRMIFERAGADLALLLAHEGVLRPDPERWSEP